jgi:hypothetical protein
MGSTGGAVAASGDAQALVAAHMQDPGSQWSVGTFGAIAEFMRDSDEPALSDIDATAATVVTARGAIRFAAPDAVRPVATESVTTRGWNHRVALCLPVDACTMHRRTVLTELGADAEALRVEDRGAILFDLGLGALQADVCVRTDDPALIARLRQGVGRPVFDRDNPAMGAILAAGPHRVFVCRFGRIEVYQPIPPANGKSPDGPHTHVLPKLLRSGLTHAATEAIPEGLVPCAHVYPAHPAKDAFGCATPFDAARHQAFQSTLRVFGDADIVDMKDRVLAALEAGAGPDAITVPETRHARAAVRVALRQAQAAGLKSSVLAQWVARHDRTREGDEIDEDAIHVN